MKAIGKNIVAQEVNEEVVTSSGLLLADKDERRYGKASVIQAGHECVAIKTGDVVYYDKRSAFSMVIEGSQYTIIQERDVVAVV